MKSPYRSLRRAGLVVAVVFAAGAATPGKPPAAKSPLHAARPNLVLITAEGLRPDRLSCYRAKEATPTPSIDSLAAEGRLFEQVLTSSVSSTPAMATLLTGRTPFQTGVWDDHYRNRLAPDALTLAERLKKEGYRTAAFVGSSRLAAGRGLDQGFDLYQDGYKPPSNGVWKLMNRPGARMVPQAKSWLEGIGKVPYFLWIHFIETSVPPPNVQTESAAGDAAAYSRKVADLDIQVGEVLKDLKEKGLYEGSVVVLTADHGLGLGDHGEFRAGVFLYDSTVRVPLLIKTLPGDAKKGSRSQDVAGVVDVFPTVERLLGLKPTPGLAGRDLLAPAPSPPPAYYAVALMGREIFGWSPFELVARGTLRLITGPATEMYDVASDPRQEKNLADDDVNRVQSLQGQRRQIAAESLPPAHFLPGRGVSPEVSRRLVAMGNAAPTPENARARTLPDPHRFLSSMRVLEMGNLGQELLWASGIVPVRDSLAREDPEGLFSLIKVAQLDSARIQRTGQKEGIADVEALLKRAQKLYPLEWEVYHLLGHLAFNRENYVDAELFLKAADELSPPFPAEIAYDLACGYARQGKKEPAISELRRAIRLGFRDAAHISADSDLTGLREDPAYKRLMQEEFSPASGE